MDIHIHIGEFILDIEGASNPVGVQAAVRFNTPWFDGGMKTGLDRTKTLQVCVACGHTKATCECDSPVYMSASDVNDSLNTLHVEMVSHLVGEDEDEDEE